MGLGARRAGLDVTLSVDLDPILTSSHASNFGRGKLLLADLADATGSALVDAAGGRVDGVVGGPPCQGFSEVGKADPEDPRRGLLGHFFRLVAEVSPRFFVMENVRGLAFSKNREVLETALDQVRDRYDVFGPVILNSADFGAATKRPRVFVIGYDRSHVDRLDQSDLDGIRRPAATVRDAIADLNSACDRGMSPDGYDVWSYGRRPRPSAYAQALRDPGGTFTGHRTVPHKPEIVERFAKVAQGHLDKVGRHPRLLWGGQCPTLRAGTGAERGSFQAVRPLHPEQDRVITVREGARLQGFPDSFRFHRTAWHSFRMIGNSVPPVMAEALLGLMVAKAGAVRELHAAE